MTANQKIYSTTYFKFKFGDTRIFKTANRLLTELSRNRSTKMNNLKTTQFLFLDFFWAANALVLILHTLPLAYDTFSSNLPLV